MLLLGTANAYAVPTQEKYIPAKLMVFSGDTVKELGTADAVSDPLLFNITKKVIFPVNKFDIPKDSPFRREIQEDVVPYLNSDDYTLESIHIRGTASPEGPYKWNRTLSQLRRRALLNLIRQSTDHSIDSCLTIKEIPEDYLYLVTLMKERGDKDYERVAEVVDKYIDTNQQKLKWELMAMDGKRLWNRLLKEYFPEVRTARVVLVFRKRQAAEPEVTPKETEEAVPTEPVAPDTVATQPDTIVPEDLIVKLPRREVLSVKTNLLFDFAYVPGYDRFCPIPNIAIEYYPLHGHFTYGASLDFPWWQHYKKYKYFQIRNYQVEARYYLKDGSVEKTGYGNGAAFTGWYAQAYAHLGLFGICFDKKRGWEGEGVGGGIGVGYVLPLTKTGHWRLEFGAQVGVFWTKYDPYQYESVLYPERHDNLYYYKWDKFGNLFKRRQHHFTWFGPTRIGITLTYDLLYHRRTEKGVSFKSWELQK